MTETDDIEFEGLSVGDYWISRMESGDYWIGKENGEGMQVFREDFERLIDRGIGLSARQPSSVHTRRSRSLSW
jgi:hypothetical protein